MYDARLIGQTRRLDRAQVPLVRARQQSIYTVLAIPSLFGLRSRQFEQVAIDELDSLAFASYAHIDLPATADSFAEDGYHPSELACRELGRNLAKVLIADLQVSSAR